MHFCPEEETYGLRCTVDSSGNPPRGGGVIIAMVEHDGYVESSCVLLEEMEQYDGVTVSRQVTFVREMKVNRVLVSASSAERLPRHDGVR